MSHPENIRKAALNYVNEGGLIKDALKIFKVSRSSFQRWREMQYDTGSVARKTRVVEPYKLKNEALKEYIGNNPDAYIAEIAEHFNVSTGCVSTALKRLDLTRKKKVPPIEKATQ